MTVTRLRHVALVNPPSPRFDALNDEDELSFVPLECVWPRAFDATERRTKSAVSSGYTRFETGDVLVPKITPTFQADRTVIAQGLAGDVGAGTTELHVVRATRAHPSYVRYLLSTHQFLEGGEAEMIGVAGQKRVPEDWLRNLVVPVVEIQEQARIAAYLDAEIERVDELMAAKIRTVEVLDERRWTSFVERLAELRAAPVPVRRILQGIVDGPFGSAFSSSEYVESGVAVVRLGNIGFARWRRTDLAFIPEDRYAEFERHGVHEGDVLIAGLGDANNHAGRACVASEIGLAIVKGKCFCARVDRNRADPRFLALFLSSPSGAEAVAVEARGSTRQMINLEIIKSVPIPLPPHRTQVEIVERTESEWALLEEAETAIAREIDLLQERRRALITAAVNGEMEVP